MTAVRVAQGVAGAVSWIEAQGAQPQPVHIPPPDPLAGFARREDLARYVGQPGAFYLGNFHPDHGITGEAGVLDDRHVFIMAGTGAGKGVSYGIQNALRWPGGFFCIDPKSELANITAMRRGSYEAARGTGTQVRRFIGQPVAVLDPMMETKGPARVYRVSYNPLSDIDMEAGGGVRQIRTIAAALITQEQGNGAHFSESAETITAGTIEAVMRNEPDERRTLPHVRAVLLSGFEPLMEYLEKRLVPGGLADEAMGLLVDLIGTDEAGSFRSTLSRNLKWMADPAMREHLQHSTFSLRDIVQQNGSVYVVLPPDLIGDFRNWLRVIVRVALSAKIAQGDNQPPPQTLFLLDEFPVLGRVKAIEESAGYMRSYGIKLVPIIQNIGQMRDLYAKNWETFLGNAAAVIAWGLNDQDSEEYISNRLGKVRVWETSHGTSSGTSGGMLNASANAGQSYTTAQRERPVMFASDVHALGARETGRAFIVPAAGRPFMVERVPYMRFAAAAIYDSREHVAAWERQYGGVR